MGRKKVELTKEEMAIREKSKKRISFYIESGMKSGVSRSKIAKTLGVSEGSLRNYQTGRHYISVFNAEQFEKKTGYVCEYWLGLTDKCVTVAERDNEAAKEVAMYDLDEWNAVDDSYREQKRDEKATAVFFEKCGFKYENLYLHPSAFEFSGLSDGCACEPHRIENIMQKTVCTFTDEELTALFSKISDLIELECFKKQKAK